MSKYSVIVPSLYRVDKEYLRLCVESLRTSGFDGEIIVVTNGTPTAEPLDIKGISLRLHTRDQGQCVAVNIGAQVASSEYLFIVNSDMYFAPGWDKNLWADVEDEDGNVTKQLKFDHPVFSPNLVEPDNNKGSAAPFLKCDAGFTLDEFNREKVDAFIEDMVGENWKNTLDPREERGFNFPVFIRKDFWQFLGGYDIAYDPWGSNSDTDLQTRINLAGVTPVRRRDVLVYHFSNKSGTFDGTHQDFYINNIDYFRSKFGFDRDELGSDVWYNKDMIPADESRIKYKQEKYNA